MSERGLVVLHVDGLGHRDLRDAVDDGLMPATARLLQDEDFAATPYRCGVPSTTPFAQAGILYGDNRDIPSFRWFDKEAGSVIQFGTGSTFPQVAHKYFHGTRALCEGGASIAGCYPAGARETFGLTYRDRGGPGSRTARATVAAYLLNPVNLGDLAGHGGQAVASTIASDLLTRARGGRPARAYVISDMLEEVLLHHVTRYAAENAMATGYPAIYAALYAFDEAGHAFGPRHPYTRAMLRHVDRTIAALARRRVGRGRRDYELVVLSDHGQVATVPFVQVHGRTLGAQVAEWLPGSTIDEYKGGRHGPRDGMTRVVLTHSGGLSHLYFAAWPHRLQVPEIERRFPGLAERLASHPSIALVLGREGPVNHAFTAAGRHRFEGRPEGALADLLRAYDDPGVLARQLDRLNSFQRSGDLLVFARWDPARQEQVNFEEQAGGHGSIGGAQLHPFVLAARRTGLHEAARSIEGAHQLHEPLLRLRPGDDPGRVA